MPVFLPLTVEAGTPILRGFDFLWAEIREAGRNGRHFTVSEIDLAGNDPHRRSVKDYLGRLVAAGIAEETGWRETAASRRQPGLHAARTYRLKSRPVDTPHLRRDGTPALGRGRQQAMWNAMRGLGTFTAQELAVTATTEERPVTTVYAGQYARALAEAGYLAEDHFVQGRRRLPVYRLKPSRNSGPKAPMLLSALLVYDQNRRTVAPATAEEAR